MLLLPSSADPSSTFPVGNGANLSASDRCLDQAKSVQTLGNHSLQTKTNNCKGNTGCLKKRGDKRSRAERRGILKEPRILQRSKGGNKITGAKAVKEVKRNGKVYKKIPKFHEYRNFFMAIMSAWGRFTGFEQTTKWMGHAPMWALPQMETWKPGEQS